MSYRAALGGWFIATGLLAAAAEATFALPAPVMTLVREREPFAMFAAKVADFAERKLPTTTEPAERKTLLAIRVHVALQRADDAKAADTAERIRALQATEAERAFTGLITRAQIAARRARGATEDRARFLAEFGAELRRLLATLPATPEIRAVLAAQRDRAAATTEAALLTEAAKLDADLRGATTCTLAQADQIIRLHHRLHDVLPLRDELIGALAAELARPARP